MGKRAQRIPSWPGVIHSNKGRIHLRRPTCDILTFRLRRSGGPYIPVCPSSGRNRKGMDKILAGRMGTETVKLLISWTPDRRLCAEGTNRYRLADVSTNPEKLQPLLSAGAP